MKKQFLDRVEYHNKQGHRHRLDGPAVEWINGDKSWWQNGQKHRLDGPACEWVNGDKEWFQNGQLHRLDGPAVEYADGKKLYYIKNIKYSKEDFLKKTKNNSEQKITKKDFSDRIEYRNEQDQRHREDGPAVEYADGDKEWYQNGKLHRDDGPAVERTNGSKEWYQNDQLHRLDGPAVEWVEGTKQWYQNGQLHREDGPAVEYSNEEKQWYQNGQRHREDGPAVERANGDKLWYQNDKLHRDDGPAIDRANGDKYYFLNGKECSEESFLERTKKISETKITKKDFSDRIEYRNEQGELHREDGPALEYADGSKFWYQNGRLHRLDGPAIENGSGTKEWYQNGQRHRLDGPAIELPDGSKKWYQNNQLHRLDGPASEWADGTKEWWQDGKLHRLDGPAIEFASDEEEDEYYNNGIKISLEQFSNLTKCKKCNKDSFQKICLKCQENKYIEHPANVKIWTKVFLYLGYTVLHDPGMSILYSSEPSQAAALGSRAIDIIDIFDNVIGDRTDSKKSLPQNPKKLDQTINRLISLKDFSFINENIDFSKLKQSTVLSILDNLSDDIDISDILVNFEQVSDKTIILKIFKMIDEGDYFIYDTSSFIENKIKLVESVIDSDLLNRLIKKLATLNLITKNVQNLIYRRFGAQELLYLSTRYYFDIMPDEKYIPELVNVAFKHFEAYNLVKIHNLSSLFLLLSPRQIYDIFTNYYDKLILILDQASLNDLRQILSSLPIKALNKVKNEFTSATFKIEMIEKIINEKKKAISEMNNSFYYSLSKLYGDDEVILKFIKNYPKIDPHKYINYLSRDGLKYFINHPDKTIRGYVAKHGEESTAMALAKDPSAWVRSIVVRKLPIDKLNIFKEEKNRKIQQLIQNKINPSFNQSKKSILSSALLIKTAKMMSKEETVNTLKKYVGQPYHYVHFTNDYSKRGLNPGYTYGNPIAIYGYPITSEFINEYDTETIPFGQERKYFILFKAREPSTVLNFQTYSINDLNNDCQKLSKLINQELVAQFLEDSEFMSINTTPGGRIYYITMMVASELK